MEAFMAIGRSIAQQVGKIGDTVVSNWKGMVITKSLPVRQSQPATPAQQKCRSVIGMAGSRWFSLTELQRAKWDALAKMLGSAYLQARHMVTRGAGNIIPNRKGVLMAGCHLYVRCNALAASSGLSYPRDEAPLAAGAIPSPSITSFSIENLTDGGQSAGHGEIQLVCEVQAMGLFPAHENVLRTWIQVISHNMKRPARLESVHRLSPKEGDGSDKVRLCFTGFHASQAWCGKEWVKFSELDGGCIRIQSEIVSAYGTAYGATRSAGSDLAEVCLPLQPNNPAAQEVRRHIIEYRKRIQLRYYYRKQGLKILSTQIGDALMAGMDVKDALAAAVKGLK